MDSRSRWTRGAVVVAGLATFAVVGMTGCSSSSPSGSAGSSATAAPGAVGTGAGSGRGTVLAPPGTRPGSSPSLLGTWTASYDYPMNDADGSVDPISAVETLVIETQEGSLVWGVDQYVEDGQTIKVPVRGMVHADGVHVTITEEGGFFEGELLPDGRLHLVFTRTDDQFTAFEAILTRA